MKYIIFVFYLMFSLKGMFAMEYEKASIALVTNFLARIEMDKPFSFDEEEHFFDCSLVGASLYIQYGYMREDGGWRWLFKPRKSLLGNIIQAHRDVFSTREFDHKNVLYVKDNDYCRRMLNRSFFSELSPSRLFDSLKQRSQWSIRPNSAHCRRMPA